MVSNESHKKGGHNVVSSTMMEECGLDYGRGTYGVCSPALPHNLGQGVWHSSCDVLPVFLPVISLVRL